VVLRLPPGHVRSYGFLLTHSTGLVNCGKAAAFFSPGPPGDSARSSAIPARPSGAAPGGGLSTADFLFFLVTRRHSGRAFGCVATRLQTRFLQNRERIPQCADSCEFCATICFGSQWAQKSFAKDKARQQDQKVKRSTHVNQTLTTTATQTVKIQQSCVMCSTAACCRIVA
jgi:hypothetical protein